MLRFFSGPSAKEEDFQLFRLTSTDIAHILSTATPDSLFILDIDDTVGRVSTSIGLDPWFRFRIQEFIREGHDQAKALEDAINIYNTVQMASTTMVPVDKDNHIAPLIAQLKIKGTKVIGLTARGSILVDKTLELLATIGVTFSEGILSNGVFLLEEKPVVIKDGVIFANGNHKGQCIIKAQELGHIALSVYLQVDFVDDSKRNGDHVAESLATMSIKKCTVWHYSYAEEHLKFSDYDKARAVLQETILKAGSQLLTDKEADRYLGLGR